MAILIKEEIVVPQKILSKLWVRNINIVSNEPGGDAEAYITMLPYNDAGEYDLEKCIYLNVTDIAEKIKDKDSNVAKAMYFLLASIEEEYNKGN